MPKYTCERCLKEFSQKSHYTKHKNKKIPCHDNKGKIEEVVENIIINKKFILNNTENIIINTMSNEQSSTDIKFEKTKMKEIKSFCKEDKIRGYSNKNKGELISFIANQFLAILNGNLYRRNHLPNSLLTIKKILQEQTIKLCETSNDGRINSSIDEDEIKRILSEELPNRIYIPKIRMWYDILVLDFQYGWLPINIKSTTTLTSDNTGNLAMCVYSYTDEPLDLYEKYQNGIASKILIEKLKKKEYNYNNKKDYYFVVVNKRNCKDIIVNSVKGLTELSQNINNLPFQVCWDKNRIFKYKHITKSIEILLNALQNPKPSWRESFLNDVRKITL